MALVLSTTKDLVTVVNTEDPDVQVAAGKVGWVPITDALTVGDQATRVVVRPLAGHEVLSCWGATDRGEQALAIVLRAVVTVDNRPATEDQVRSWGWEVLIGLRDLVVGLSTVPTVARP